VVGVLLAIAILAGLGMDTWMEHRRSRDRVVMVVPGLLVWLGLPVVFGAGPSNLAFFLAGAAVTSMVMVASLVRRQASMLVPLVLAVEVLASSLFRGPNTLFSGGTRLLLTLGPAPQSASAYTVPPPLARDLMDLDSGRYVTLGRGSQPVGGFKTLQNNESMVFGLENVGGYQAAQLARYWLFVRTMQRSHSPYNYALFGDPSPTALDLLDVNWIIASEGKTIEPGAIGVSNDGSSILYRRRSRPQRVSVHTSWTVLAGPDRALQAVAGRGFDASGTVVLEKGVGIVPSAPARGGGTATYRSLGPQAAEVHVDSPDPAIVLVRNMWDPNWHADVDGHAVRVFPTDYVDQGIPVPAGRHTIELTYHDPTIGYGLVGSALSIAILLGAAGVLSAPRKRESTEASVPWRGERSGGRAAGGA